MFSFIGYHQTVFQSGCTTSIPTSNIWDFVLPPYPCQYLMLSMLWILAILKVYSGISLLYYNIHFLNDIWLVTFFIYTYLGYLYLLRSLLRSLAHFLNGFFVILLSFQSSLYILDTSFIKDNFCSIFPSLWLVFFILLTLSYAEQKFLILMKSCLFILSFMDCAFGIPSKK